MAERDKIEEGHIVAKTGAWQRKYKVVRVSPVFVHGPYKMEYKIVELELLGNYWADGRKQPSAKRPHREIVAPVYGVGGQEGVLFELPWYTRDHNFKEEDDETFV